MRTIKAVLREKFIVLQNDLEKTHTRDLIAHLKDLEQKEANSLRRSKRKEVIKHQAEINKIET